MSISQITLTYRGFQLNGQYFTTLKLEAPNGATGRVTYMLSVGKNYVTKSGNNMHEGQHSLLQKIADRANHCCVTGEEIDLQPILVNQGWEDCFVSETPHSQYERNKPFASSKGV